MALVYVHCPECQSIDVVQYGKQANGTQRYRCNNRDCPRTIFLLQYSDKGRLPAVKQQIVDMTLNGSGVRDIVRVLRVSSATVIDVLKKKDPAVKQVNERLLHSLDPPQVDVILRQVDAAEMDEMWSFVGSKSQQRWLWHAIDHHTGLGCPNRLSSVDRFLYSRCQSRPSCAWWRNIFKEAKPTRRPQWGPMLPSTTI